MEFCFETVNWSPYFGFEMPAPLAMVRAFENHGYASMSLDMLTVDHYLANGGSMAALRAALEASDVALLALHSLAISTDMDEVDRRTQPLVEADVALGAHYLHAGKMCERAGIGFAIEFLPFLPIATINQTRDVLSADGLSKKRPSDRFLALF